MSDILKQHRDQIDAIDEQLLKLVNERAQHAREIGNLKNGGPIYRPEREAQVLRRLLEHNGGPLSGEAVTAIFSCGHVELPRPGERACSGLSRPVGYFQ